LQNIMKRVIIPQEYVEKIKKVQVSRRNGNIKTDQFWTFRHDLWKIASY
jgi:hypothetical protein